MSRFYASINGQARTQATRRGSEKSGISGHVRGWDVGIDVQGFVDEDGENCFRVVLTRGSSGCGRSKTIGTFTKKDLQD